MKSVKKLTGSQLKLIAMVSMLIDHFAAVVLLALIQRSYGTSAASALLSWAGRNRETLIDLYYVSRHIGRFAFPIYCFLLVEGFVHTRSAAKYALRLAVFCLISEIPFDLAFNGAVLEFDYNNVFFTLLTGLLCIWAVSALIRLLSGIRVPVPLQRLFQGISILAVTGCGCCLAQYVFRCDYAAAGVLAIVVMFLLKKWPVPAFAAAVGVLSLDASIELYALIMLIPVYCYNGQRGRPMKLGPYIFYPAHLLVFFAITLLLGW